MTNRDKSLVELRPELSLPVRDGQSEQELFQNQVLRPILKLQHPSILLMFSQLMRLRKIELSLEPINLDQLQHAIDKIAFSDNGFKDQVIGMILALMTHSELSSFFQYKSEYRRRILTMAKKRIESEFLGPI